MSEPRPPGGNGASNGGVIAGVVGRVLGFLDRPWKALALAGLMLLGGTGWVIWTERERLLDQWFAGAPGPAVFRMGALPDLTTMLLWQTTADIVSVWTIELGDNAVHYLQGRRRGGGPWQIIPSRLPAVRANADVRILVKVLDGHSACIDPQGRDGVLAARLVVDGIHLFCWVPVDHFGAIALGWVMRPDDAVREAALGVAHELGGAAVMH